MTDSKIKTLGCTPSFGFGDRIGLATPGHVEAMNRCGGGIAPIFPQQSIREMTRTLRSPETVMSDALQGMESAGWTAGSGADADHLKTSEDVDRTVAAGFTFFTIDPSDNVDEKADGYDADTLKAKFDDVKDDIEWLDQYLDSTVTLPNDTVIEFDHDAVTRAAVKYGKAIREGLKLAKYIREANESQGRDHEIELSVDETEQPTTLAEHYIIADQCLNKGMNLVSLAPRFVGELEKGVDYIGDVDVLEQSLNDHNAIAEALGPYKLSLHSGSDKVSMYTAFARATKGRFHVKTAGTSYLEALRVSAHHDPDLFHRICRFARERYNTDKATYHVHATLETVPDVETMADTQQLEKVYLECWEDVEPGKGFTEAGRQILHCTFGSVLTDSALGPALKSCLESHPDTYREVLAVHFGKHLDALKAGMPS